MPLKPRRTDEQTDFARQLRAPALFPSESSGTYCGTGKLPDSDFAVRFPSAPTVLISSAHQPRWLSNWMGGVMKGGRSMMPSERSI